MTARRAPVAGPLTATGRPALLVVALGVLAAAALAHRSPGLLDLDPVPDPVPDPVEEES